MSTTSGHSRIAAVFCALAVGVVATEAVPDQPPNSSRSPREVVPSSSAPSLQPQGNSSCARRGCHGGVGPSGQPGGEYTLWDRFDPHAQAHAVLSSQRSVDMIQSLERGGVEAPMVLCLKCHSYPGESPNPGHSTSLFNEGIGCESCHGPSQRWLSAHVEPAFRRQSPLSKGQLGLTDTGSLAVRARLCARCHVGEGSADVNHDLIAAGHPRLGYEFSAMMADLPERHWSRAADLERQRDFEARAWVIGQLVSAQASLRLLAHRAATPSSPWPEFSEHGCFHCHKDLTGPGRLDQPQPKGERLARLVWGSRILPGLLTVSGFLASDPSDGEAIAKDLDLLKRNLEAHRPRRAEVEALASSLADRLEPLIDRWSNRGPLTAKEIEALAERLQNAPSIKGSRDWESSSQACLGLESFSNSLQDLESNAEASSLRSQAETLRKTLAFPGGLDSPRAFGPRP